MASIAFNFISSTPSGSSTSHSLHSHRNSSSNLIKLPAFSPTLRPLSASIRSSSSTTLHSRRPFLFLPFAAASQNYNNNEHNDTNNIDNNNNDNNNNNNNNNNNSGGGGGGGEGEGGDENNRRNKEEAMMALKEAGKTLDNLPEDLKAAVLDGRIPASVVNKFFELEKSSLIAWLLKFGGFRERLLADDLFLAKVAMECGVGMFTKTAAEYEKRKENFFNELEVVCADVVMAVIADFMLVYLPAPTVSLRAPITLNAGGIAKFFHFCPDNAFQVALPGTSYSLLQRLGAIARNGSKLFAVGTASSLIGTSITNAVINAKKATSAAGEEVENIPVLATSAAYGVYMAISSNLRYQIVAGVFEQRILEPMLHQNKLLLSALCFAVRTGNTYLGSLLWVDYARWVGIQKVEELDSPENAARS